jgi:hypothetical protein
LDDVMLGLRTGRGRGSSKRREREESNSSDTGEAHDDLGVVRAYDDAAATGFSVDPTASPADCQRRASRYSSRNVLAGSARVALNAGAALASAATARNRIGTDKNVAGSIGDTP